MADAGSMQGTPIFDWVGVESLNGSLSGSLQHVLVDFIPEGFPEHIARSLQQDDL